MMINYLKIIVMLNKRLYKNKLTCQNPNKMIKRIVFTCVFMLVTGTTFSQGHSKALAAGNSEHFIVNKKEGWELYNSCLKPVSSDSIMIGLILQHDHSVDLSEEQFVGRIKSGQFSPEHERKIQFSLLLNIFQLRIENSGKCYLSLVSGSPFDDSGMLIIPVKAVFKK